MLTQVSVFCLYELCWKSGRQRRQRGSAVVVILRTSFYSDANGELICWTLTLIRTLLHLCVIVMDYDYADCDISYLSTFVFLFMYISTSLLCDRIIGDILDYILIYCVWRCFRSIVVYTRILVNRSNINFVRDI